MFDAPFGRMEKRRLFPIVLSDQVAWQFPHCSRSLAAARFESRRMATKLSKRCDLFDGSPDGVLNLWIRRTSQQCLQFGCFLSIDWREKPNVRWRNGFELPRPGLCQLLGPV
jgi:hypothetical protein